MARSEFKGLQLDNGDEVTQAKTTIARYQAAHRVSFDDLIKQYFEGNDSVITIIESPREFYPYPQATELLRKFCEFTDGLEKKQSISSREQVLLGYKYYRDGNKSRAEELLQREHKQDGLACFLLAQIISKSKHEEANKLYEEAAKKKCAQAFYYLANNAADPKDVESNLYQAFARHHPLATFAIAKRWQNKNDRIKYLAYLNHAARFGMHDAIIELGKMHVTKNPELAKTCFAAAAYTTAAFTQLGKLWGTSPLDYDKALACFQYARELASTAEEIRELAKEYKSYILEITNKHSIKSPHLFLYATKYHPQMMENSYSKLEMEVKDRPDIFDFHLKQGQHLWQVFFFLVRTNTVKEFYQRHQPYMEMYLALIQSNTTGNAHLAKLILDYSIDFYSLMDLCNEFKGIETNEPQLSHTDFHSMARLGWICLTQKHDAPRGLTLMQQAAKHSEYTAISRLAWASSRGFLQHRDLSARPILISPSSLSDSEREYEALQLFMNEFNSHMMSIDYGDLYARLRFFDLKELPVVFNFFEEIEPTKENVEVLKNRIVSAMNDFYKKTLEKSQDKLNKFKKFFRHYAPIQEESLKRGEPFSIELLDQLIKIYVDRIKQSREKCTL